MELLLLSSLKLFNNQILKNYKQKKHGNNLKVGSLSVLVVVVDLLLSAFQVFLYSRYNLLFTSYIKQDAVN